MRSGPGQRFGRRAVKRLPGYLRSDRGAAAAELALWLPVLILPLLNVVDIGFYIYQRMQVENAATTAAHAAWVLCSSSTMIPATKNCANLTTTVQSAAQQTSLGTKVSLDTTGSHENYFCTNKAGALKEIGTAATISSGNAPALPTNPSNFTASSLCSLLGSNYSGSDYSANASPPGDYLVVQVTSNTVSLFPGATVTQVFGSKVTGTALVRLL